jgi:hypothetical protein
VFAFFDRARWRTAIQALRGARKQAEIAAALGLSNSQVSRFESGENTEEWFDTRLAEVAAAYCTTVEALQQAAGLREGPEPWHPAFPGVTRDDVTIPVPVDGAPDGWGRTAADIAAGREGTGWMWVVGPPGTGRTTAARQLAQALGATLLLAEPAGGWAAFRFLTPGRFVAAAPDVRDERAQWMEDGRPQTVRLRPAAWSAADWRALLVRLDAVGRVPRQRRAGVEALCERLGGEDLPWELGVQALADHLAGETPPPADVWETMLNAAVERARAHLPGVWDEAIADFWAARRLDCPGDGWETPTVAEVEALLPAVPDVATLRARVQGLREGRRGLEAQLDALDALLVDPAVRREAWERGGLLRRVEVDAPAVHPYTLGVAHGAGATASRLAAPHAGLALTWCARGLPRRLDALAADTSWLLDPSWGPVLEAVGRLGQDPTPWIALVDGARMPIEASRAIVLLASTHPVLERFPAERLGSAWAETLLTARLARWPSPWDGGRLLDRALERFSRRARGLLPVLGPDAAEAMEALRAHVRPGVDVDPHGLLPTREEGEGLQEWMPGRLWEDRRSFVHALAGLAPWQLPLVEVYFHRWERPPVQELLAHGAARGLVDAARRLVYREEVPVAAEWIGALPDEERAAAFLYLWERAGSADADTLVAASAHVPGLAPLLRLVDAFGLSEMRFALRQGEAPWWGAHAPRGTPPRHIVALVRVAIERAEGAGDADDGAHLRTILRRVATDRVPLDIHLSRGQVRVDEQRVQVVPEEVVDDPSFVRDEPAASLWDAVSRALQRRDGPRSAAASALYALGEPAFLRDQAWKGLAHAPADVPRVRRLALWERVRRDVALLLRGGDVPEEVHAFLAGAAARPRLAEVLAEGRRRDALEPETVPDLWWHAAHYYLPGPMRESLAALDRLHAPAEHAGRARRAVAIVLADTDGWPLGAPIPDAVITWLLGRWEEPRWADIAAFSARASAAVALADVHDAEAVAHWVRGTTDPDDAVYGAVQGVMATPTGFEESVRLLEGPDPHHRRFQLLHQAAVHHLDRGELPAWLKTLARAEVRRGSWPGWLPYSHQRDAWSLLKAWIRGIEDPDARVRTAMRSAHAVKSFNEIVSEAVLEWLAEAPGPFAPGEVTYGSMREAPLWRTVLPHVEAWLGSGTAPLVELGEALASLWAKATRLPLSTDWDQGLLLRDRCPEVLDTLARLLRRVNRADVLLATFRAPPETTDDDVAALSAHPVDHHGAWGAPYWCPFFEVPARPVAGREDLVRAWLFDSVVDALGAEARDWSLDDPLRERRFEQAWAGGDPALVDALFARLPEEPTHPRLHFAWFRAAGSRPTDALARLTALWARTADARWLDLCEETDLLWGPLQGRALTWARRARAGSGAPSGEPETRP